MSSKATSLIILCLIISNAAFAVNSVCPQIFQSEEINIECDDLNDKHSNPDSIDEDENNLDVLALVSMIFGLTSISAFALSILLPLSGTVGIILLVSIALITSIIAVILGIRSLRKRMRLKHKFRSGLFSLLGLISGGSVAGTVSYYLYRAVKRSQ